MNFTNQPFAKRARPGADSGVIFDMTPWASDFAAWREHQIPVWHGTEEEVNEKYSDAYIIGEAENRLAICNANEDDPDYQRDARQLERFINKYSVAKPNKPEEGKQYLLIGGKDKPSIANGNTWAESEIGAK